MIYESVTHMDETYKRLTWLNRTGTLTGAEVDGMIAMLRGTISQQAQASTMILQKYIAKKALLK